MKKKIMFITIMGIMLLYAPVVNATNITGCSAALPNVQIDEKLTYTVHTIITIIKILVPILLVVFGSIDLVKGMVAQKEDEIKKGQHMLVKRLITGALVFFVISIVQLVISFVSNSNDSKEMWDCVDCFINNSSSCKK